MGKLYNVVLNSAISNAPGQNDNDVFFYDWMQIPEGKYKCSFTYINAQFNQRVQFYFSALIFVDLGQTNVFFATDDNNVGKRFGSSQYNQFYIGGLENRTTIGSNNYGYYYASTETNPPIFLDKRPTNNVVNVRVVQADEGATQTTFGYNMGNYILTLHLELLD